MEAQKLFPMLMSFALGIFPEVGCVVCKDLEDSQFCLPSWSCQCRRLPFTAQPGKHLSLVVYLADIYFMRFEVKPHFGLQLHVPDV